MVVNEDQGWAFVHVPKTGGKSVTAALGGLDRRYEWHLPVALLPGREKLFTFGFVRNPWDWLVSHYEYLCQRKPWPGDLYDQARVRREGFREWLLRDPFLTKEDVGRRPPCRVPMQQRSQMYWLHGCDFIGRFEDLAADFARACEWAGIDAPRLPHRNRTRRGAYRDYYDATTRDAVGRWHADLIQHFGYTF